MKALIDLANHVAEINVNEIVQNILKQSDYNQIVTDFVRERLWEQGLYSSGRQIQTFIGRSYSQPYAPFTVRMKRDTGDRFSHVTLRDTGEFYNTFALKTEETQFYIEYDENKPDGKISDNVPELPSVFGLSDGELDALRAEILPDLQAKFLEIMNS